MPRSTPAIPDIRFHQSRRTRAGADLFSLKQLRQRAPETLRAPQRLRFHLLLVVRGGHSGHMVDFEHCRLATGDVLWLQPGQVQQWQLDDSLKGTVLLLDPARLGLALGGDGDAALRLGLQEWPQHFTLPPQEREGIARQLECVADALRAPQDNAQNQGVVWHLLLALLLRLGQAASRHPVRGRREEIQLVHRLRRLLEQRLAQRPQVAALCQELGVAQSTLARACLATEGVSIKALLDRRTVLEAKRLLVHSADSVNAVSEQLGFDEPSNFVKFFRRLEGTTPGRYREGQRGVG